MRIQFAEEFALPAREVYAYFHTPADWVRLFGFAGRVTDRGGGWFAVPFKRFPFPLVARVTVAEPHTRVRWVFRGFWRGDGEVRLTERAGGVRVEGYESITMRWLPGPVARLLERSFMDRELRRTWGVGWRRLRERAAGRPQGPAVKPAGGRLP
ncbi:MAG TPA: SRPBCC family protein [Gemmatimonadales bacterium]|nr:SRPBCC family protein [Gemmatimonadales bacterium]